MDKQTNKCKGYGFVDYIRPDDAIKALNEMKKEQRDVQFAKQREQDPTNLYFANLPSSVDEKCLTELLKKQFNATVSSTRWVQLKGNFLERCVIRIKNWFNYPLLMPNPNWIT